jgi:hypothetical protein
LRLSLGIAAKRPDLLEDEININQKMGPPTNFSNNSNKRRKRDEKENIK